MRVLSAVLFSLVLAASLHAATDLVTAADIEKATGLTGVHKVAKDPAKGAGGELNFAGKDEKLVAIVMISPSMFDFWKKKYAPKCESVSGIGDEAYRTKRSATTQYLFFRKGANAVWIQSMGWTKDYAPVPDAAQLTTLAKVAASRM
ncbi:MAG: hypothetical protein JO197_22380 [Acidobacteria bacterium]|nr:hypothetical protein [Acidobacteriota bacterium]MBV9474886.1 hypothetical protein [Acidobacteriota bacterium]